MVRERSGNQVGRPSKFRQEYAEQAFKFCLLGATDADLGRFFDVDERTINNWKESHPEFLQSLKAGKEQADARVAQSLYRKALGWEHEAVKIVADAKTGTEHVVPYAERYPPDTTAAIFWLKNRRPDLWRDKQQLGVQHSGEIPTTVRAMSDEELLERASQLANRVAAHADGGHSKKRGLVTGRGTACVPDFP